MYRAVLGLIERDPEKRVRADGTVYAGVAEQDAAAPLVRAALAGEVLEKAEGVGRSGKGAGSRSAAGAM